MGLMFGVLAADGRTSDHNYVRRIPLMSFTRRLT